MQELIIAQLLSCWLWWLRHVWADQSEQTGYSGGGLKKHRTSHCTYNMCSDLIHYHFCGAKILHVEQCFLILAIIPTTFQHEVVPLHLGVVFPSLPIHAEANKYLWLYYKVKCETSVGVSGFLSSVEGLLLWEETHFSVFFEKWNLLVWHTRH